MTRTNSSLRLRACAAFAPDAGESFSTLNRFLAYVILLSVILGVVSTEPIVQMRYAAELLVVEAVIGLLFTVEFALRLWSAGVELRYSGWYGTLRYIRRPLVLIDLLVIVTLIAPMFGAEFAVLRMLRLLRMLALAKFGRYSIALRTLVKAVRKRRYELSLSVVLASLILLLSATAMYLIEGQVQPEVFGSIPRSLWWSVATLTTVGYGDVYPVTAAGKLFAGLTAIAGIGLIALPAGILASAFSELSLAEESDSAVPIDT